MSFKLRLQLGFTCGTAADSYDLYSQIFSVYQRSFEVFFFFFLSFFFGLFCFYFRKRKSAKIYEKYPFLVLFGATDRNFTEKYSIVITYMFMTNDRCEDSFVQIRRLQHVLNDIQVEQCTFRGLRIAQIPMKEGAAFWTSAALSA